MNTNPLERFMNMVFKSSSGCWIWTGTTNGSGYGHFWIGIKKYYAHRWIYEYENKALNNLNCLHSCDNPNCVNPKHLYAGTQLENIKDCIAKGRHKQSIKTHCPSGHTYNEINTYMFGNERQCRICKKNSEQKRRNKKLIKI